VGTDLRVADVPMNIGARNQPRLMPRAAHNQTSSRLLHREGQLF
jgi:hypothetical protein